MELWQYAIIVVVSFFTSIMSGVSGAGGGFIMTPLSIAVGLTPAQAVSTGKIAGLMVTIGSLSGLRKSNEKVAIAKIAAVMIIALIAGLLAPLAIINLDSDVYKKGLGVLLLCAVPLMAWKKIGIASYRPSLNQKISGGVLLGAALLLMGIFSGGLGTLVNAVLMGFLGMNATEANITKRWSQLVLNVTVALGVLTSGLILWPLALAMIPMTLLGSYIGAHIGVKRGNAFVVKFMIGIMILSALYLLLS